MPPLSASRASQSSFPSHDRHMAHSGKYHPRCGTEHQHKPAKAVIGVALLIVLSFLLYDINGKAHGQKSVPAAHAHQTIAGELQ